MNQLTVVCFTVMVAAATVSVKADSSCSCQCGGKESPIVSKGTVKQCVFQKMNDDTDNGLIRTCDFQKRLSNTALRVTFQGDMLMVGCPSGKCCRRWFITINGKECSSPAPVDAVIYVNAIKIQIHRPGTLDGLCQNIPKGHVTVGLSVGACPNKAYPLGDAYTGWNSVSRFIIEEVSPLQSTTA